VFVRDKYGAAPTITYFESPVVVENSTKGIVADDASWPYRA
jgi:hypothetical protein